MRETLDNGLEVVLIEDHSAPVVALNIWVRVGSADERPEEGGMAHVFEHMLFKGTKRRAVGEIAATVEAAGGNINAFTSFDMTVYHITMASRDAAVGIDVLADAVQHSTFDPTELAREEEVVLEEIRRSKDSPQRELSQAVFSLAYRAHPYRLPVIGTEEQVESFTREQLLDFYHRWYVPNNMTFVAVGDLDPEATLEQIRAAFAEAKPRRDLEHARMPEPPQEAPHSAVVRRDFEQTLLGLAYPITAFRAADTPYLDLLSQILGGGESSRLYRNVKDRLETVHTIGSSAYTPLDPGLLLIDAAVDPEGIESGLEAVAREIQRLRAFGPSEVELERARVNLLASQVYEKETMQGQARKLGYYETLGGGLEAEAEYLDRIKRATPEDIERVARTYLAPDRVNVVTLLPQKARPDLSEDALLASFRMAASRRPAPQGAKIAESIFRYTLPNGLRVIVKPNPTIPLVSLRIAFLGGQLVETEQTQGLSSFLADLLERGTEQRSAAQLAAEIEGIAGSLEGFSGRNSFGLSAEFLSESLDTGLELFTDVLLHPAFDALELEKLRTERLAELKRREDHLSHKAFELFSHALFGDHPYGLQLLGTQESVSHFEREALRHYYERYARPRNGVLAIVGDVDPDAFVEVLSARLAEWPDDRPVTLAPRPEPPEPDAPRRAELEKGKAQVHLVLGFPGLALDDPDLPALEVLTQILSGQGGRLFLELRDRRSLAYSVSAFSIEGVDEGAFGVYIASAPDKLDESLAGLERELARLSEQPVSAEELSRAKGYLIGSHAVALQRFATQASQLSLNELYGLGATHHLEYAKRIDAVELSDVERVLRRVVRLDRPLIAIVR
ncbi:MAG: M16 family metallopeptidase [Myxococcota bacterium]